MCGVTPATANELTLAPAHMGRLAELSLRGLQHAQALQLPSLGERAERLYAWNRLPSSAWRRVAAEADRITAKVTLAAGTTWIQTDAGPPTSHWCRWRPIAAPTMRRDRVWKVYISPHPQDLADNICIALSACEGLPILSLKYGADEYGMLRPDKLVVHLATRDSVDVLGGRLLLMLGGCPVHGVPFTAELGGDGLVSWGCDPPAGSAVARVTPSWRSWVTQELARGLACGSAFGIEPWQHALQAIALAGVDPVTWAPSPDLWATSDPG